MLRTIFTIFLLALLINAPLSAQKRAYRTPEFARNWGAAGVHPDHIVLNLTADPAHSMSVTWRTNADVPVGYAEIAPATGAPKFWRNAKTYKARTETLDATQVIGAETINNYHAVTFTDLLPDALYAYRVGDGRIWSEWIQFRTAPVEPRPFSFLYVGDAQNYIMELWSRLIREGYRKAPDAGFIIHAGDLINTAHNEREWHEWFMAGSFIHAMLPSVSTPGNHEYRPRTRFDYDAGISELSVQWQPQFTLPQNGLPGLEETVYYLDYQNTRLISLNSNRRQEEQIPWLREVLENNPKKWTIVTYHHPLYSASTGRNNERLRNLWKPVFDEFSVDLVLQGHDHSYARGRADLPDKNIVAGMNARDQYTGTVYVVSVSGGKMYGLRPDGWEDLEGATRDRGAENTQLFQVVTIDDDRLSFEAYTATGELYDAFDLRKSTADRPNTFVERKDEAIPARRHENTIPYEDTLPEELERKILRQYRGSTILRVRYYDEPEFTGYTVRLSRQDGSRINLRIDTQGNILAEER